MNEFLKEMTKEIKKINEFADIADNGIKAGDISTFIDTGSYWLNAMTSGSIYGGYPNGKITQFASPSQVGKSMLLIAAIKSFLNEDKGNIAFLFESESALTKNFLMDMGIDTKRVLIIPVITIEEFRFQAIKILNSYKISSKECKILMCLDSLGMLSTMKEIDDTADGKDTRDMTRAALIKSTFRVLTLNLGSCGVPLLVTNHVYSSMSMFGGNVQSGGSGPTYSCSNIIEMSKRKIVEGTEKIGNIVTCKNSKGRLTKEGAKCEILISFAKGLSRYHGMVEAAVESGVWKKSGNRIEINNKKLYPKEIYKNPEQYFAKDILDKINDHFKKIYLYGETSEESAIYDLIDNNEGENV